ncbi:MULTISPECIES: hypothetical protein [Achromobacter]|uniref:hypothetical protein n=1 Tax=Achromobacter TaxID=222 RepID=UPI0015831911|nr:hypothetical protein [Achromobacter animicus]
MSFPKQKVEKRPEGAFSVKAAGPARLPFVCHLMLGKNLASGAGDQNKTPARVGTGAIKVILWSISAGIASRRRKRPFRRISAL